MLHISSGLLRGVPLRSPSGSQTRPTSERLRQAIFNVLRHYRWLNSDKDSVSILEGAVVADVFAGTGAWGIEALSNGATEAWFIESHPATLKVLEENLDAAARNYTKQGLEEPQIHLLRRDALQSYGKLPVVRLLFCDPPYGGDWFNKVLQSEDKDGRLAQGGVLVYEAGSKEPVPTQINTLKLFDSKIYGDSAVHFFIKL